MQHTILLNIPIVSTETFSMRTIIPNDDCGYLMPMDDIQGMSEKVQMLMDNEVMRNKLTGNALANFDKFSSKKVGKQLCDSIESYL